MRPSPRARSGSSAAVADPPACGHAKDGLALDGRVEDLSVAPRAGETDALQARRSRSRQRRRQGRAASACRRLKNPIDRAVRRPERDDRAPSVPGERSRLDGRAAAAARCCRAPVAIGGHVRQLRSVRRQGDAQRFDCVAEGAARRRRDLEPDRARMPATLRGPAESTQPLPPGVRHQPTSRAATPRAAATRRSAGRHRRPSRSRRRTTSAATRRRAPSASAARVLSRDSCAPTRRTTVGIRALIDDIAGGSSRRIADARPAGVAALNALLPRRHLVQHRAERKDVGCARQPAFLPPARATCTAACPGKLPGPVRSAGVISVATTLADPAPPPARSLWRGRNRAASRPTGVSITLPGFRSRWTMPRRCAASSASAISTP